LIMFIIETVMTTTVISNGYYEIRGDSDGEYEHLHYTNAGQHLMIRMKN